MHYLQSSILLIWHVISHLSQMKQYQLLYAHTLNRITQALCSTKRAPKKGQAFTPDPLNWQKFSIMGLERQNTYFFLGKQNSSWINTIKFILLMLLSNRDIEVLAASVKFLVFVWIKELQVMISSHTKKTPDFSSVQAFGFLFHYILFLCVNTQDMQALECSFLCIHRSLYQLRLSPNCKLTLSLSSSCLRLSSSNSRLAIWLLLGFLSKSPRNQIVDGWLEFSPRASLWLFNGTGGNFEGSENTLPPK